jgi:catechol 2,3-dioxygenase-like lactoylglutathione lyase family enzyme
MSLHTLASVEIGVPNVAETSAFYTEFGLTAQPDGWLAAEDGGAQFRVAYAPTRRLLVMTVSADDEDDLTRAASALTKAGFDSARTVGRLSARDPVTGVSVVLMVTPRTAQPARPATTYNGPGRHERDPGRAPAVEREDVVRPLRLGHAVLASTDIAGTRTVFSALGFKLSDEFKGGAFLRCSEDHHNCLLLDAPVSYLHHTAWQVNDVDEVGRGAMAMLEDHPDRHIWGLGRHYAGSNFFWYLKDPAGNFAEYFSDMDYIDDDANWTAQRLAGRQELFNWGPPLPKSFLRPDDLDHLIIAENPVP